MRPAHCGIDGSARISGDVSGGDERWSGAWSRVDDLVTFWGRCSQLSLRFDEAVPIETFDLANLVRRQRGKFPSLGTLGQPAIILLEELVKQFDLIDRHVDHLLNAQREAIEPFEENMH